MADEQPDNEFTARQDPRLYPVGRLLRATYDADNHETLDPVTTGLMLDLARIDPDEAKKKAAQGQSQTQTRAGAKTPMPEAASGGLLRAVLAMLVPKSRQN